MTTLMDDKKLRKQFSEHLSANTGILHKICNVYCSNKEDKKDLMQEVTLQLWKSFSGFKGESKFSSWMYRIALNTVITNVRRNKKNPLSDSLPDKYLEDLSGEDLDSSERDLKILYEAIAKLNDIEKAVIILYLDEHSYREIGLIVGLSEKNVSVRIVRIKSKLQKLLEEV